MTRTASEIIHDLELKVATLELKTSSLVSNRNVQLISAILGEGGSPNGGAGWNWSPTTTRGHRVSLYYTADFGDEVEIENPPSYMGVKTDSWGIGYLPISSLRKFFQGVL